MEEERVLLQMLEVLLKGGGLQKTVDQAAEILGKPLWILDLNFRFMTDPGSVHRPVQGIVDAYANGGMSRDMMQYVHRLRIPETIMASEKPFFSYAKPMGTSMAITAIRINGVAVAYLASCDGENNPLCESDLTLLARAREVLALELQRRNDAHYENRSAQSHLLDEILDSKGSLSYISSRMEIMNYRVHPYLRLLVASPPEGEAFPWFSLEKQFAQIFSGCIYTVHRGYFVLLINQRTDITDYQMDRLKNLLNTSSLRAGISYRFRQLPECHGAYLDTLDLLQMTARLAEKTQCCRYEEYIPEIAAHLLSGKIDQDSIAEGAISKLLEYDRKYGQESLKTLQALACCAFNVKRTADMLHVHKNTMRYRVNRLEEILDISFADNRKVFELTLALTMYQLNPPRE